MIVYVESNFVLEHVLAQEEYASCEALIQLAIARKIELVIPAYCLMEPFETLTRRKNERKRLKDQLDLVSTQVGRSHHHRENVDKLNQLSNTVLIETAERDWQSFESVRNDLLQHATVIALDTTILQQAIEFQSTHNLTAPDAAVYASIRKHIVDRSPGASLFLNKNSKDFGDPDIRRDLSGLNCKIMFKFDDGLGYIKSQLV